MPINFTKTDQGILYTVGTGFPTHTGTTGDFYTDVSGGTNYSYLNSTWKANIVGTGSTGQLMYWGSDGTLTGSTNLSFNGATNRITLVGSMSASTMSATTFFGDGSRLTNVSLFKLVRHDFVSPYSYCGTAVAGTAESSAAWQIKRINVSLDGTTVINTATNAAWTGRYSATYI
jgi:hypothetical protein